jgi:hypothetical protein
LDHLLDCTVSYNRPQILNLHFREKNSNAIKDILEKLKIKSPNFEEINEFMRNSVQQQWKTWFTKDNKIVSLGREKFRKIYERDGMKPHQTTRSII